jgi:hypothetical protein
VRPTTTTTAAGQTTTHLHRVLVLLLAQVDAEELVVIPRVVGLDLNHFLVQLGSLVVLTTHHGGLAKRPQLGRAGTLCPWWQGADLREQERQHEQHQHGSSTSSGHHATVGRRLTPPPGHLLKC